MNKFMSEKTMRIFLGALLVLAGGIFLVQQFVTLPVGALFVSLMFFAAGAVFLFVVIQDRNHWWALIPGFTLIGLGATIAATKIIPAGYYDFGGSIFLGSIALGFIAILILKKDFWWPMIPAGVLTTLALVAGVRGNYHMLGGAILFLGIGATFALITLLPSGKNEKWAWIPGGICLGLGLLLIVLSGQLINSFLGWALALLFILAGAYLVFRAATKKEGADNAN